MVKRFLLKLLFALLVSGEYSCSKSKDVTPEGDASKGLNLYLTKEDDKGQTCVSCHCSPDGVDIMEFGKLNIAEQDKIVIKRATDHVTPSDASHILAYLKTLRVSPNDNEPPIKSPKGRKAHEIWDGSTPLNRSQVLNWNFWNIGVSFEFPKWFSGDNTNNLPDDNTDWIAEISLPIQKPALQASFQNYLKNPTYENVYRVIQLAQNTLTEGEKHPGEHGYYDFKTAFDYQRWLSTLYIQHIRREKIPFGDLSYDTPNFSMLDPIWDVGNVARRSQDNGGPTTELPNRLENEVRWLYLAWLGNMGKRNSFETQYIGTALKEIGERDLCSLVILRSMLHRSPNSQRLFDDIFSMTYLTSVNMLYQSLKFGLGEIKQRLRENWAGTRLGSNEANIIIQTYEGQARTNIANSSLSSAEKNEIFSLLNDVLIEVRRMR